MSRHNSEEVIHEVDDGVADDAAVERTSLAPNAPRPSAVFPLETPRPSPDFAADTPLLTPVDPPDTSGPSPVFAADTPRPSPVFDSDAPRPSPVFDSDAPHSLLTPGLQQLAVDATVHKVANAFHKKHNTGIGANKHVGFEAPVKLELAHDTDGPDPRLSMYGTSASVSAGRKTHASILELLQRLEDVGKEKRKSDHINGLRNVLRTALKRNSLADDDQSPVHWDGDSESKLRKSETTVEFTDEEKENSKRRKSSKKLMLKDAVHKATEKLGANEVLNEIRARKNVYSQVLEQLRKHPKNKKYAKDHPYVVLRKKLEEMANSGRGEYHINFHPQRRRIRGQIKLTRIPDDATRQDSYFEAKMKRIKKMLLPLIIVWIFFAAAAVMAYDCVRWVYYHCPRCKNVKKVKPEMHEITLPELPSSYWKCTWLLCSCCKKKRKLSLPPDVEAAGRFYARRKGLTERFSDSKFTRVTPLKIIHPGYVEGEWSILEMSAEEAFFSHSVLVDELRRLYIVVGRRIIWNKFCNAIIGKKKILTLERLTWCVIRLHRNSYMKLQLNFIREMIRQSSLANVTGCSTRKVVKASPSQRKRMLVECIMKRIDMSRVIRKERNCTAHGDWISEVDIDSSSGESYDSGSENQEILTWMRRDTLYDGPSSSEGSSGCSGESAYRRALGRGKPSHEEVRIELTIMILESLNQPYDKLLKKLRVLKRKRHRRDLRAMAYFDSNPQEYLVDFKVTVTSGELKGQSIVAKIRIVEVDCSDHFVLRRLPIPRPPVIFGIKEKVEQIEERDWQHKVIKFVIGELSKMWSSTTFAALRKNSSGDDDEIMSKERIGDDFDRDIYSFLDPLRTVVVVIEPQELVRVRRDKYRWLAPPTKRQILLDHIPGLYFRGWGVKEVTLEQLIERSAKEAKVYKMLRDPSDIRYHNSSTSLLIPNSSRMGNTEIKRTYSQTNISTLGQARSASAKQAKNVQAPDSKSALLQPRNNKAQVAQKEATSNVPPAIELRRQEEKDQVFAGHKALVFLESRMKVVGNDIFIGEKRRAALHLSELDLTSSKLQPDDKLPASASYGNLLEERRKNKKGMGKNNQSDKVETSQVPKRKPTTVILLKPKVNKRGVELPSMSTSSASSYAQSMKESNQMFLAVPESVRRMSLQPVWSLGDERLGSKSAFNLRRGSIRGAEGLAPMGSIMNLEYSNLKNDNEDFIYYSIGKMLVIEKKDKTVFSVALGEDSIASPSSVCQMFSSSTALHSKSKR